MKEFSKKSIEIININQNKLWDDVVKAFVNHDVYYFSSYAKCFQNHGDGEPILVYYNTNNLRCICVYMKRCIPDTDKYYDIITPYGYGGFLFNGDANKENMEHFISDFRMFMQENNIVTEFVRYHPQIRNADIMRDISNVINLGKTISIDLSSPEVIWQNIDSKCRNMIRKAEKSGVVIKHSKDKPLLDNFMSIYNETMNKDSAIQYYYFKKEFYELIYNELHDNYEMFYAEVDGKIVAMSIILFANNKMHYHLSGSLSEYRNFAPTNLLLYKAACWGCEQEFMTFHLGGGLGSKEDNLYKFKVAFNKKSDNTFSIGKTIFNHTIYNMLVNKRVENDKQFDINSAFFPLYRA